VLKAAKKMKKATTKMAFDQVPFKVDCDFYSFCIYALLTHPQLLEGLKEESQVENNGKREGVGAHSLTRSTKGVEGHARAPGLGLGRMTSLIYLLEPASN
jgi:hypothetical protein